VFGSTTKELETKQKRPVFTHWLSTFLPDGLDVPLVSRKFLDLLFFESRKRNFPMLEKKTGFCRGGEKIETVGIVRDEKKKNP
jgi:hypothetical protein